MAADLTPPRPVRAVLFSLALSACNGRRSYDLEAMPSGETLDQQFSDAEAAPARPIVAGFGDLLCRVYTNGAWDIVVFPFSGAEHADVEVRARLPDRRARVVTGRFPYARFASVAVEPGARIPLEVYDLDQWFHEKLGTYTLKLEGSWPVEIKGDNATVRCHLLPATKGGGPAGTGRG